MRRMRKAMLLGLLLFTVVAPIFIYRADTNSTDTFTFTFTNGDIRQKLNLLPQESLNKLKEPAGVVYFSHNDDGDDNNDSAISEAQQGAEHTTRVLSSAEDDNNNSAIQVHENPIKLVTTADDGKSIGIQLSNAILDGVKNDSAVSADTDATTTVTNLGTSTDKQSSQTTVKVAHKEATKGNAEKPSEQVVVIQDTRVRHLKDQLIRARVYLSLGATRNNPHFIKELRLRIKEVLRALGDATKDSELPRSAYDKLKAMEQALAKGKQIQDDCTAVIKKLRAILHSTEEQLKVHKKQTMFLTQLAAKTLPKGLHCLPLRLSTEYYSLNSSQQQFPYLQRLEDPKLYHYALFSDNILAAAAVVNSTVSHAQEPENQVFHIVTDKLNYAAMRMWFLANPPGKAAVEVQNIEEFTWLNSSYIPVLKQLGSASMIDYYFKAHRASSDSNLKFRNPKYLSILNHLRFYLPEIFPKLNKVLFLDDDIVVQKDLTGLWSLNLKGNVNGAVETCRDGFHRFDRYLNFSNPLISKNFDPHACGWAYGMNIFDLEEWKKQNITEEYHSWQKLNEDRQLWKLGTLPPGLITFWKRTFPLDKSWHVLGLGYNPNVNQREIERAAVIHYNGNMKPWLEIGIPKYRGYWAKFVDYDQVYLRDCNINP